MKRNVTLALFLAIAASISALAQEAQPTNVLHAGDPPLTQVMVDKTVALLKWVLEIEISAENKSKLQEVIVRAWRTGISKR